MLWLVLFAAVGLAALFSLFYLITRFHKFSFMQKLGEKRRKLSWVLSSVPVAALISLNVVNAYTPVIVLLHLSLIWGICDLVTFIHRKVRHSWSSRYKTGAVALSVTAVYMLAGWFFAHHVFETDYRLKTKKELGDSRLRVALIADSHIGVTLDGEKFAAQMKRLNACKPDAIIIAGDFVDDDTKRDDMVRACQALGETRTKYGVFYADGNHDKGYGNSRGFSIDDLYAELEKNGVTVLLDETAVFDHLNIIGRKDYGAPDRKTASELTDGLDTDKYTIMIDHQPRDYAAESGTPTDLVLSGHTHGGHIFPAALVSLAFNDKIYGKEVRDGTTFIVTSGISGWVIPFKTGCISEFVIIDVYDR